MLVRFSSCCDSRRRQEERLPVAQSSLVLRIQRYCAPVRQRLVGGMQQGAPTISSQRRLQFLQRDALVEGEGATARADKAGKVRAGAESPPQIEGQRADVGSLAALDIQRQVWGIPRDDGERVDAHRAWLRRHIIPRARQRIEWFAIALDRRVDRWNLL